MVSANYRTDWSASQMTLELPRQDFPRQRADTLYTYSRHDSLICVYCNGVADSFDHVLPLSIARVLPYEPWPAEILQLVPCCRSCNSTAGDRLFSTLRSKREYIQSRIFVRASLADLSTASICEICLAVKLEARST
jgi:5-methylcytosine-specific restriction endonuclease McrA